MTIDTPTAREYLKAILRLEANGDRVSTSSLAEAMGVSPGTATDMVKRLADAGLVAHVRYRGVHLSGEGRHLATAALRRHRVVERFLTDMLGFQWFEAHRLALGFEHHLPTEVEERMFEATGRPATCPHGYPILEVEEDGGLPLTDLKPGDRGFVTHVAEEQSDEDLLAFIDEMGLRPGVAVQVRDKQPFEGPIVVRVGGKDRTVGERIARQIYVRNRRKESA